MRPIVEAVARLLGHGDFRGLHRAWDLRDAGRITEDELDEARRIADQRVACGAAS